MKTINVPVEKSGDAQTAQTVCKNIQKDQKLNNQIIPQNDENVEITLKEITDLISVEHNKAMKQVEKLAQEPSFGGVKKIATPTYNPNGSFNRNIDTYKLNKKQAIAVGAKLNNALLMKVIDRLEELEKQRVQRAFPIPQSFSEALRLAADLEETNQKLVAQNNEMKPKAVFADSVAQSHTSILIGQFAKAISNKDFTIGQNKLFSWLRENKYLINGGQRHNQPMQKYIDNGYFDVTERTINNPDGSTRITITTKITGKGQVALTQKIREYFSSKDAA